MGEKSHFGNVERKDFCVGNDYHTESVFESASVYVPTHVLLRACVTAPDGAAHPLLVFGHCHPIQLPTCTRSPEHTVEIRSPLEREFHLSN